MKTVSDCNVSDSGISKSEFDLNCGEGGASWGDSLQPKLYRPIVTKEELIKSSTDERQRH